MAGLSVWLFAQAGELLIWAAFIGRASYDADGAARKPVIVSTGSLVFGAVMAWLVAVTVAGGRCPGRRIWPRRSPRPSRRF